MEEAGASDEGEGCEGDGQTSYGGLSDGKVGVYRTGVRMGILRARVRAVQMAGRASVRRDKVGK